MKAQMHHDGVNFVLIFYSSDASFQRAEIRFVYSSRISFIYNCGQMCIHAGLKLFA